MNIKCKPSIAMLLVFFSIVVFLSLLLVKRIIPTTSNPFPNGILTFAPECMHGKVNALIFHTMEQ